MQRHVALWGRFVAALGHHVNFKAFPKNATGLGSQASFFKRSPQPHKHIPQMDLETWPIVTAVHIHDLNGPPWLLIVPTDLKARLKEASPGASERLIRSKLALGNLGSSGTTVKVDLRRQLQHRSRKPSALLVTVQLPTNNMKHTHSHATQIHSTALPFAGIEIQAELFGRQVWQHTALCNANSGALEC